MKPHKQKPHSFANPHAGKTRPPEAPLNEGVADAFRKVEPLGFQDHPESSQDAAVADPDVDDSEGGE